MYEIAQYCLKNIIHLTPADAYEVLRAKNLNSLLKFVIDWLKREIISMYTVMFFFFFLIILKNNFFVEDNKYSKSEKTGLVPMPSGFVISSSGNRNLMLKKRLSSELKEILKAIESVLTYILLNLV